MAARRVQALVGHILEEVGTLTDEALTSARRRRSSVAFSAVIPLTLPIEQLLAHVVVHCV